MNKFIKEPLLHFLIIGAVLFFVYSKLNNTISDEANEIHVTKVNIQALKQRWIDARGKNPTDVELKNLIDNFILDEVLYREALLKNLDKNDKTIHKHLVKKLKYVLEDLSIIDKPTDAQLEKFLQDNMNQFITEKTISFNQIAFTGKEDKKEVAKLLAKLRSKKNAKVAYVGDLVTLNKKAIEATFSKQFSDEIFTIKMGRWVGPIHSKHGLSLVYVHSRSPSIKPSLKKIRDKVLASYMKVQREKANQVFYAKLKNNYKVTYE